MYVSVAMVLCVYVCGYDDVCVYVAMVVFVCVWGYCGVCMCLWWCLFVSGAIVV